MNRYQHNQLTVEQLDDRLCLSTVPMVPAVPPEALVNLYQPKPEAALNHGVTVLAWARVDGVSPLNHSMGSDRASDYSAIAFVGGWGSSMYQYSFNDPSLDSTTPYRVQDDVVVDGRIITGENYDSADIAFQGYVKIKKLNSGG